MTEKFKGVVQKWYDRAWGHDSYRYPGYRKVDYITDDMSLYELGMDSLDEVELIMNLEIAYDVIITDEEISKKDVIHMRFSDMCDWIESKPKIN